MVQPKMVYISNPTEVGTIYSKAELTALSETCHKYGLYLFLDGARLGYGLAAPDNDLTLPEIAALCDVFYIGGGCLKQAEKKSHFQEDPPSDAVKNDTASNRNGEAVNGKAHCQKPDFQYTHDLERKIID